MILNPTSAATKPNAPRSLQPQTQGPQINLQVNVNAKQLAEAKAVVKNLTDVETLGATSAINTDKTGTLTLNQMMVSTLYVGGAWFTVEGEGYRKTGEIRAVAGVPTPDFTRLGLGLVLDSDAVVGDDGLGIDAAKLH